ncbi:MAG: transposase [Treponema sp.]|nr:transposase [Treponema sp.]
MQARKALIQEVGKRYQKARKKDRTKILDELTENTGCNRKYLPHTLANRGKGTTSAVNPAVRKRRKGGGGKPKHTGGFIIVLRRIRAFFSFRCGKILSPFMREQTGFPEQPFRITEKDKEPPLSVGPSTVDRLLKAGRKKLAVKGKSGTKPGNLLKKWIPVRTYYADADKKPCFFGIDTVHRRGTSDSEEFCLTLTATGAYSGRTEPRPTLNKAHKWVFRALPDIKSSLPFPLTGIDSDNGGEFINAAPLKWRRDGRIRFARSRAYRKNDNCFVEQKNYSCVRNLVGYYRFSAAAERDALSAVYRSLCPLLHFFMPTLKLISKTRVGTKIKKAYDKKVISPYRRLMASPDLCDEAKAELAGRMKQYDPVKLRREVRNAAGALVSLNRAVNLEGGKALAVPYLHAVWLRLDFYFEAAGPSG